MNRTSKRICLCVALSLTVSALIFSEDAPKQDQSDRIEEGKAGAESKGIFIAIPAYLYGRHSTYGIQAGYQLNKAALRLDAQFAEDYQDGESVWFFMPSLGLFHTQELRSIVRFHGGLTFGWEKGIHNSFDGISCFLTYIAGAEFLPFKNKTFFVEIGSGMAFRNEDGAYNGGTIIGGGFKHYF